MGTERQHAESRLHCTIRSGAPPGLKHPAAAVDSMSAGNESLTVDGIHIYEGTAIFDTAYYRVLWITEIGPFDVKIEPITAYAVDERIGWNPTGNDKCISKETAVPLEKFKELITTGRFDPGPPPRVATE